MPNMDERSNSQDVNVMIVIDTDYVKSHYPSPSKDPNKPTGINHNSQFMICNGEIVSGQGTADLQFKAHVGDHVSFRGTSISGNSDDAVIVYGIKHWQGDQVFNSFTTDLVERTHAVAPNVDSSNGLPPSDIKGDYISYDSKIRKAGHENFYVQFGLYELAEDREAQLLKGYYYWDPGITVQ
jgi:hypothetical protein